MNETFRDDPVLRLLPEDPPAAFMQLDAKEQAVRGRYFLMVWVILRDSPVAWFNAMGGEPELRKHMQEMVDGTPDENLIRAVGAAIEQDAAERQSERVVTT